MSDASTDNDLFWRDEVMEAMYWMLGEGIEDAVAPADLRGFLDAPSGVVEGTFQRLEASGHLEPTDGGYVFTERGDREAAKRFADEFADVQGFDTAHNDCGPDCWCHDPDHVEEACPTDHEH
ncbi:MAG: hypothetical protein ACI8U4_001692 [Natronomonas sp.]|jgi:hypothetical protein